MNWAQEATYIEQITSEPTGDDFLHCDAIQLRYCRMQMRRALKDGDHASAARIKAAIDREWPTLAEAPRLSA